MLEIAKEAKIAMDLLKKSGYESYLVGGCVRDYILGREFNDYDITTSALPEQIKEVFSDYKVIETGIKHGTVTVIIGNLPFEITTYRIDGEYLDNRHPKSVVFSNKLYDDLSRRDFTINALAYNDKVVDLFDGVKDIENKVIRCVGEPDKRFNEDALRIMRALRFASVLGFDIEQNTAKSIIKNKELLKNISAERIYVEFSKLICGKNADKIIADFGEVFDTIFLGKDFSNAGQYINNIDDMLYNRLSLFFLNDEYFENDLKSLKPDNKIFSRVTLAIKNYNIEIYPNRPFLKNYISNYGADNLFDVCMLKKAYGQDVSEIINTANSIIENDECCTVKQLSINGNDVKSFGYKDKDVGKVFKKILELVIKEEIKNDKEEIIKYLKENKL